MGELEKASDIASAKIESSKESQIKYKHGGKRPGAGFPKGKKKQKTLDKMRVNKAFNELTMRAATKLFNAQMGLAVGTQTLYVKYYVGSGNERKRVIDEVTDPETIKEYLIDDGASINAEGDEYYYLMTNKPDNRAIDSLLNRALGKAPDKIEVSGGFFNENNLTIEVVGDREDIIDIGEDGRVVQAENSDPEQETESSNQDSESPTSS